MHSKKIRQAFSVILISALVIPSAVSVFATSVEGTSKGKPEHVIEKQQESELKREENLEKQNEKREESLEKQSEKKEEILKRREEVRTRYTEEELEALNENAENMKNYIKNGRVMPFDSIISNRKNIKFDTPPVIKGDRTLVPLRAISEGFKADVEWNGETREVTITKDNMEIVIKIDSNIIFVNGEQVEIDSKAEIISERTYVPLRFIAETLGIKVVWDQETETIELKEELEVLKSELQEELEELNKKLEELQNKLDELQKRLEDLKEESENANTEYQEELEELEKEFTKKIEELEEKIKEMESDLQEVIEEMEQNVEVIEDQDTEDEDTEDQNAEDEDTAGNEQ